MNAGPFRTVPPRHFKPPEINFRAIALGLAGIVAVGVVWSSVFTIAPEEVGVILTFGKYSAPPRNPGLQFKAPWPIQTVTKVPVQRQLKQEFGFRTQRVATRSTFSTRDAEGESLMLTGDLNVAVVEWITQYRVKDPEKALFKVRHLTDTFRDMNEAVMRTVVGDRSVTEVLTVGREEIASEVELLLQEMCDQYQTGLKIEQVVLQDVNPPEKVKASFNEVNQAEQERDRKINVAEAERQKVIPKARGDAQKMIAEAEGYAAERVNRARGDAARFEALRKSYERAPQVTRRRIYLETMQKVLPSVKRKIVLDEDLNGLLPLLSLDEGRRKP